MKTDYTSLLISCTCDYRVLISVINFGICVGFLDKNAHLQKFICLRRWEKMTVRQLMQGVKTTHCGWLSLHGGRYHSSRSEGLKRTELLGRLFAWLMSLVTELIKVSRMDSSQNSLERGHLNTSPYRGSSMPQNIVITKIKFYTIENLFGTDSARWPWKVRVTCGKIRLSSHLISFSTYVHFMSLM